MWLLTLYLAIYARRAPASSWYDDLLEWLMHTLLDGVGLIVS